MLDSPPSLRSPSDRARPPGGTPVGRGPPRASRLPPAVERGQAPGRDDVPRRPTTGTRQQHALTGYAAALRCPFPAVPAGHGVIGVRARRSAKPSERMPLGSLAQVCSVHARPRPPPRLVREDPRAAGGPRPPRSPDRVLRLVARQPEVAGPRRRSPSSPAAPTSPATSGLEDIFEEISPIEDFSGSMSLSFRDHRFEPPKYTVEQCRDKDFTYAAPLFVTAEFMNNETGEIKSQTVFMGDFPLMTDKGTFIINGTERVVVSQLVRSPGVYFERTPDKTSDKDVYVAKIIPSRGAWLEFEVDKKDMVGVRVDRKRKQPVTVLLKALGMSVDGDLRALRPVRVDGRHPREGRHRRSGRGPQGHLPQAASGRAADHRGRPGAARQLLLQPQALRPRQGRSLQDQQEARHGAPADAEHDHDRRHRQHDRVPRAPARRRWTTSPAARRRHGARSRPTTSTTSATVVCARSASSSRTRSARVCRGWSASCASA